MDTVYLAIDGSSYSYNIVGVYDRRELADKMVELGYASLVEVHRLNQHMHIIEAGLKHYELNMDRDGRIEYIGTDSDFDDDCYGVHYHELLTVPHGVALFSTVWARDEQHAVKIANERRVQLIASGEWDRFEQEHR